MRSAHSRRLGSFGSWCKALEHRVHEAGSEATVECAAAQKQSIEDRAEQELVHELHVRVFAQVTTCDSALDHGRELRAAWLDHALAVGAPKLRLGSDL